MHIQARKLIGYWLLLGAVLIFIQVIIGGVTRLTGSGLSITEWKPIVGAIPPLNEQQWNDRFNEYQQIVQYKHLNEGMTLPEFKFIFFWEYFHRLWARFMGFAFVVPFLFFMYKKWIDQALFLKIGVVLLWGGAVGLYGWIMVKNGLTGLFVPPVFLSIHLMLALSLYAYLVWLSTYVVHSPAPPTAQLPSTVKTFGIFVLILLFVQLALGGIVSGTKAGLSYPTWPDMNGAFIPPALSTLSPTLSGILHYNPTDEWARALIQFVHRAVAYLLVLIVGLYYYRLRTLAPSGAFRLGILLLPFSVLLQVSIGIITVINCRGTIPVFWGVVHQAGAMVLLANVMLVSYFVFRKKSG
ncbi:MAG: COX15/CtaA family protein [Bacteroidetes bacterium]|nr:COX15/CtaA family protein [Bacteroidota bacterium]